MSIIVIRLQHVNNYGQKSFTKKKRFYGSVVLSLGSRQEERWEALQEW